jgi:tetratricopeptide (TPR) repeat protein
LTQLQDYPQALQSFENALSINAKDAEIWAAKGLALLQLQRYDEAIIAHEQALQRDVNDDQVWYNKACCHAHLQQLTQAIDSLEKAIDLNPEPIRELASMDSDFYMLYDQPAFQKLLAA